MDDIRKFFLQTGYTCDGCGAELFDYPCHRLCAACEEKLRSPKLPCEKCGREKRAEGLCNVCKETPPKYERGLSPYVYKGEGAQLINRFKGGNPKLAVYFGEKMGAYLWEACEALRAEKVLFVPVPTTKLARAERGYNQAERLLEGAYAEWIRLGGEGETDFALLEKSRETRQQKRMSRKEREENVRGAYAVANKEVCKDRVIVLVDDVTTSGSTGNEITKRLLKAKAKKVYFLTAAAAVEQK